MALQLLNSFLSKQSLLLSILPTRALRLPNNQWTRITRTLSCDRRSFSSHNCRSFRAVNDNLSLSKMPHFDVLIVGGGMAGVSTAYHLSGDAKFNGTIGVLEARQRWGGRIHGTELMSTYVELGANWIHGILGNPICDLALKHKLVDPLGAESQPSVEGVSAKRYFVSGTTGQGEKVPISLIADVYNAYFYFTKQCDSYHNDLEGNSHVIDTFENSLGKHLAADVHGYLESSKMRHPDNLALRESIFKNLLQREACISGSDTVEEVSLSDFGAYEELPGGNLVITGGFSQIISLLLQGIERNIENRQKSKSGAGTTRFEPFFDHRVVKINWSRGNEANRVEVTCADGTVFTCSHLVCTLPLGVLKEDASTLFEPQLPSYKMDSISRLGFDVVNKIFLEYRQRISPDFWDSKVNEMLLFWPEDEQDGRDKTLFKDKTSKEWWKTIYSFAQVSDRCLMGWLSGTEAELVENMNPEDVGREITENIFRKVFNNLDIPEPDNVVVTKWKTDPLTRGSYTFVKSTASVKDVELLAQPIYSDPGQEKPILLFAGEACHSSYFSTTHGAFLTGRKAASYLLDTDCD